MSNTTRTSYLFAVKEYGDGTPWIALEPRREQLGELKNSVIGFDLSVGVSLERAKQIADYLNENLGDLSLTTLE